ncbi:unnamed protein product [Rotaria sp. Silwood2]|nr:unnamed protein product [Rotaria sp. Silwood2]CAF2760235.1 unnamed protein product [Rotaria sp. Silwood2]CAF4043358.1 unnamed protein product [Rotaria sp. Silwood2]CAF4177544.1 unnamed protein product [Rotaria sp. Silwood2]
MGFKAAVALGNGLTKDRFVQACMRMKKLGSGHSLTFWSSYEVYQQIKTLKTVSLMNKQENTTNELIKLNDILRWVYENTQRATWDDLHHWATQSLSFQRNISVCRSIIPCNDDQQTYTDIFMENLAKKCSESDIIELIKIRDAVLKRLYDYGGTKQRLSQLLDEEQQRELEQELEEERSPLVKSCELILHKEIKQLWDMLNTMINLADFPTIFRPLTYTFMDTIFVNNYANYLIGCLNSLYHKEKSKQPSTTILRLLLPCTKRIQSIILNTPILSVPPSIGHQNGVIPFLIPLEWLVQLFIFNSTLYFETIDEQTAYCQCLSLCPKEEETFQNGWIAIDGFVSNSQHRQYLQMRQVCFHDNFLTFIKQIIENRNNTHASISPHVGSIILNSLKLI